jgi:hypothetical protein
MYTKLINTAQVDLSDTRSGRTDTHVIFRFYHNVVGVDLYPPGRASHTVRLAGTRVEFRP